MDFQFDDDELEIIGEAGRVLRELFPVTRFRDPDAGAELAGWTALSDLGWLTVAVPEQLGGGGLGPPVVAGIMREAGRNLLVDQFVNNAYLLPTLCAHSADGLEKAFTAPGFLWVDGRATSLATDASCAVARSAGVGLGFHPYRLSDDPPRELTRHEPLAAVKTVADGLALDAADVAQPSPAVATFNIEVDDAEIARTAGVLQAAALVGLAEEALRRTVEYAIDRVQFGVPIGSFQAVKHGLADVYARNETAWGSVVYTAALDSSHPERRRAQLSARVAGLRAADEAVKAMSQYFGGIGYTWESDVHWFLKCWLDASQRWGGPDVAAYQLGQELVGAC